MAATLPPPRLLPSGDSAITVEFSRNIDDAANRRVLALDRAMTAEPVTGVTETVPTYRSLLVHYDPEQIDFDKLGEKILALAQRPVPATTKTRRWRIPVVYGGEHGIDLEDVAKTLNTTPDEIVARHVAGDYRVAMIGFTPGWSYLSGLDGFPAHAAAAEPAFADAGRHHLDRRGTDRRAVPRRPERLAPVWDERRSAPISCIAIRSSCWSRATTSPLQPVDAKTFAEQDRAAEAGEFIAEQIAS